LLWIGIGLADEICGVRSLMFLRIKR